MECLNGTIKLDQMDVFIANSKKHILIMHMWIIYEKQSPVRP